MPAHEAYPWQGLVGRPTKAPRVVKSRVAATRAPVLRLFQQSWGLGVELLLTYTKIPARVCCRHRAIIKRCAVAATLRLAESKALMSVVCCLCRHTSEVQTYNTKRCCVMHVLNILTTRVRLLLLFSSQPLSPRLCAADRNPRPSLRSLGRPPKPTSSSTRRYLQHDTQFLCYAYAGVATGFFSRIKSLLVGIDRSDRLAPCNKDKYASEVSRLCVEPLLRPLLLRPLPPRPGPLNSRRQHTRKT